MTKKLKSAELTGKTVTDSHGHIIGQVNEILIDPTDWHVTDLQVKIDKANARPLGLKTPFFGSLLVLVHTDRVRSATDQVLLTIAKEEFRDYVEDRKKQAKKSARDKS